MIGRTLKGLYRIYDTVGVGGFATVYLGRNVQTNQVVAIKVLHSQFLYDPQMVERFLREAGLATQLTDPHIVEVLDHGREDDALFLVMEYVQGNTLAHLLQTRGVVSIGEAASLVGQMLQGLQAAHQIGIVHRDLKPQNLMLTLDGDVKIMDFGIAKNLALG